MHLYQSDKKRLYPMETLLSKPSEVALACQVWFIFHCHHKINERYRLCFPLKEPRGEKELVLTMPVNKKRKTIVKP